MYSEIRRELLGEKHSLTADSYDRVGVTQHEMKDFKPALHSKQCVLEIRGELFGEKHSLTADSYRSLGVTQLERKDLKSALQSEPRALEITCEF